mgnify:CR=1 FL=1
MKIYVRLMLGAIAMMGIAVVLAAGSTGWFALKETNRALSQNLQQQFQSLAESRAQAIQSQFSSIIVARPWPHDARGGICAGAPLCFLSL